MKIAVMGYCGGGKSTLTRTISEKLGIPALHIDSVYYSKGWVTRDRAEARNIVREFVRLPDWVIDGNYRSFSFEERLRLADRVVFIDMGRFACLWRVVKRYFKWRGKTRPNMAVGCDEKLDLEFVSWVLFKTRTKKERALWRETFAECADKLVILKRQRDIDRFVEELPPFSKPIAEKNA